MFKRFNDHGDDYKYNDFHNHTSWTDGNNTAEQMIQESISKNLNSIAITDHIRETSTYFQDYYSEISTLRNKYHQKVYIGFEAKVKDYSGNIDVSIENIKLSEISIGSVHRFPQNGEFISPGEFSKNKCEEIELELSLAAINNGTIDMIGHPGGMSIKYFGEFNINFFEKIIIECNNNNIAFDFNYRAHNNFYKELCKLLELHNPLFGFSSDAHNINSLGSWIYL
jgi:putative hydrolase